MEKLIADKPHIKIKKFPDDLDVNKKTEDTVLHRDGKCPFCGNSDLSQLYDMNGSSVYYEKEYKGLYKQKPVIKNLFNKKFWWYSFHYKCFKCGAEWESEEFPKKTGVDDKCHIFGDIFDEDDMDMLKNILCAIVGFLVTSFVCCIFDLV